MEVILFRASDFRTLDPCRMTQHACCEHGRRLGLERAANCAGAFSEKDEIDASPSDGTRVPNGTVGDFSPTELDEDKEVAS